VLRGVGITNNGRAQSASVSVALNEQPQGKLAQRFLNIRDGCLGKSLANLRYEPILDLLMQCRADLAQGLWIGDQDQRREVSAVGTAIELSCQLLGERGLVSLLV